MTQPPLDPADAVIATYQQQTTATREHLAAAIIAVWRSLPDYRNASMREFVGQVLPFVNGAVIHMQALTAAYLAALNALTGRSAVPAATPTLDVKTLRGGADPAEVYGRPFNLVWRRLHELEPLNGPKIEQAIQSGQDRALQTALTDLQLAKTHTARDQMALNKTIVGYRRELEGAYSCALCVVASTRLYHKADLMPIHPACDCGVVPIFEGESADLTLDPEMLDAVHATVADKFGSASSATREIRGAFNDQGKSVLYRDVLITHEHGELGPVLAVRGQTFTGPAAVA